MAGQITLAEALGERKWTMSIEERVSHAAENIQSSNSKQRAEGLADLKHILRHNQNSSRVGGLKEASFFSICQSLFQVALDVRSSLVKAKTQVTRTTCTKRLSEIASALRQSIEAGVRALTSKSVNSIVDHVTETIFYQNGGAFCEPLALDYAKSLRAVLTYQPHVEVLGQRWATTVDFCISCIKRVEADAPTTNGAEPTSTMGMAPGLSYRSSHSTYRDTGSQGSRSMLKPISDEMIACLRLLTAAPAVPLLLKAHDILWTVIDSLKSSSAATRSHQNAFAAVNNVLTWSRAESIGLTQEATSHLVRLISHLWAAKSTAKNEMLITLLLLRPYIFHAMRTSQAVTLRADLVGLSSALQNEYSRRQDARQLNMDDLRLDVGLPRENDVATVLFSLRCTDETVEADWTLVFMLASIYNVLTSNNKSGGSAGHDSNMDPEDDTIEPRPRKRARIDDELSQLIDGTSRDSPQSRTCAIQTICFLVQQKSLAPEQLSHLTSTLAASCSEDTGNVSSWAYLALACCAAQVSAQDASLSGQWASIWQLSFRALSNTSACRAASHALHLMLELRLVQQTMVSELVQTVTHSIDLGGPNLMSDASSRLLRSCLEAAQHINPGTSSATSDSIVNWLSRNFTPSRLDDKTYVASCLTYEAHDVLALVYSCVNQYTHQSSWPGLRHWDAPACVWIHSNRDSPMLSYLLLAPDEEVVANVDSILQKPTASATNTLPRTTTEALVLTHLGAEISRVNEMWKAQTKKPSTDAFSMLCKASTAMLYVAECVSYRDTRRQNYLQTQARSFFEGICDYVSSSRCEDPSADALLLTTSKMFSGLTVCSESHPPSPSQCEQFICETLKATLTRREDAKLAIAEDDAMELDEPIDSQDSRESQNIASALEPMNDLEADFSKASLRSCTALYANSLIALRDDESDNTARASSTALDYLLSQSEVFILSSRQIITMWPKLGLNLDANDAEALLEQLMKLVSKYAFKRSEVALGTVLDIASSLVSLLTDKSQKSLYGLGLDIYEWYLKTFLPSGLLSPNVQKRLATLLLQLCHFDLDYGHDEDDESPTPSARSSLCKLFGTDSIAMQFYLASRIPELFGLYVLSYHANLLEDLLSSMQKEVLLVEAGAVRLLFLAKIAAAWPSLLTQCVYHLFESAAKVPESRDYATRCIKVLASQVPSKSPRKLFSVFAPQILYTWLASNEKLGDVPYAAFQYSSLGDFLATNCNEVCAQLVMWQSIEGLEVMSKALKLLRRDLVKSALPKSTAYAICHDVSTPTTGDKSNRQSEECLREILGKETNSLMLPHYPTIMGHFYLTTRQDDPRETWMEKRPGYSAAWSALQEMKCYSHSKREVPDGQQPHFRGKYLPDEIERLCRRINYNHSEPWTASMFTLAVRMLVDAIDASLGSLHACLMIRRLRDLICMAGDVAFSGFAIEMLLHSLRPFVSDSECADDTIGILQYLFHHGRQYLRTQPLFLTGTSILLILQMRAHSNKKQDRTTQESQHTSTLKKMMEFQGWLVRFLSDATAGQQNSAHTLLTGALSQVQLPGNARRDSPESIILLFLLEQWRANHPSCSRKDSLEAIGLLGIDFQKPSSKADDCLGDDDAAVRNAQQLWEVMQSGGMSDGIATWAVQALGRAYAASGSSARALSRSGPSEQATILTRVSNEGILYSQAVIAERLTELLYSKHRTEAGLADFTLRRILETPIQDANEAGEFEKMLPPEIEEAFISGSYGYEPAAAMQFPSFAVDGNALRKALATTDEETLEQWATRLAVTVCNWAVDSPIISSLAAMIQSIDGLAIDLLPSIVHILLFKEVDKMPTLRTELSSSIVACLSRSEASLKPKQRFLLQLVLYLKSRPYPNEATKADRLRWLDLDYLLLAEASSKSGMPTTALLFAESSAPTSHSSKRSSTRVSTSQLQPVQASEDLLLSIYQQLEEPDSFYGVPQPASLDSILNRLDHERDGLRSLMFRSAQVDSLMQSQHQISERDANGMVRSLSALNFNSLAYALLNHGWGSTAGPSTELLGAAKTLQQWDITPPETHESDASLLFSVFQELSRANDLHEVRRKVEKSIIEHAQHGVLGQKSELPDRSWLATLASITEIGELLNCISPSEVQTRWQSMQQRLDWMHMARFDDVKAVLSNRQTLFSTLTHNPSLQKAMHLSTKQCYNFEVGALLDFSKLSREHSKLQEALTATTNLSAMVDQCLATNLKVEAAVKVETASVLWQAEESSSSVRMLRDALNMSDMEAQDLPVGRAGLLAQLGHQLGQARLEKPEDILGKYLKPAINHLKDRKDDKEAGKVFYEFARFCDNEYQNPGNVENFHRIIKLRQGKQEEVDAIRLAMKNLKKNGQDRTDLSRQLGKAEKWLEIDKAEEKRLAIGRKFYIHQSLQNYLYALRATDEYDICVLRFFALWLENADDQEANGVVSKYLPSVPSWKLVLLMNQLMSRVENEPTAFQAALQKVLCRIFVQHPHHSMHHLFSAQQKPTSSDPAAVSRFQAASTIFTHISKDATHKPLMDRIFTADRYYKMLAEEVPPNARSGKAPLKDYPSAVRVSRKIQTLDLPPATISLPLRPSGDYSDTPTVVKWEEKLTIMNGLSAPKTLTAIASDGKEYKQLFKSGDDDLRQDAIMEQVFEEVSKMLRNHKATRQRDLKVRTYKVIPLTTGCGIIEFVPNSIPFNDWLRPAHKRYHPQDYNDQRARDVVNAAKDGSVEHRVKEFRKVCDRLHPVLRHFFFELFDDPDEWFEKRTNYSRTTASISILGYILGLGDRHCSNILLDQQTGECVHIDLGVAFEAGRILPIPEMVPFRLTRDVMDGMGATGTEGVFRRCCEFTLDAVRDDKDSIMTLLNVLRYDPLYNWTLSPVRAKRMQEAQDTGRNGVAADQQGSSKRREQEAGEADRSLSIVEKKLSKTLSTAATVNELIQQATDERHLATLFSGWAAYF
ncbi:hypothetical protein M409DRAFT_28107 [Zasmidium cellare ATCC 36951]|uniref:Serine/threonine-protein kinase Tel1 n=1 Tax=Zasmidium cellare ATCC 36951 TaxID=1080233 RepID=A0A6A6C664_ZASCE|nr:uncharacterized protein M409DRAFT_28107 [Zasmidium cellare ATCC 36951]KAF2161372.1 hypothetical protein M409DRAFT_28107 [Zasmidium cellare ATCC 36951]